MPWRRHPVLARRPAEVLAPALLAGALAAGCAPTLDWREVRPEGAHVQLLFPCKPKALARDVKLADVSARMTLTACEAGGHTWALAYADLREPARVGVALQELRSSARGKLPAVAAATAAARPTPAAASGAAAPSWRVSGATPNPEMARERLLGRLPDGRDLTQHLVVFARGTVVYQATALGSGLPDEAAEAFIGSLRVLP